MKIKILRSGGTNHLRSERRRENYTVFCTLKMGVWPKKCPQKQHLTRQNTLETGYIWKM